MRTVDGLLLSREEARAAAQLAGAGLDALRYRNGTVSPGAVRLVEVLAEFGRRTPEAQDSAIADHAEPGGGADPGCSGPRAGVTAVARRLGVSAQTVRRWCRSGELLAWRSPGGGPWIIDTRSAGRRAAGE